MPLIDSDNVVVGLDVFHQLHCLDSLRQSLRPERYTHPDKRDEDASQVRLKHWDHCVEMIRQNLMCSADISPVNWAFLPEKGRLGTTTTDHVCRKWEPIKQWAEEHIQIHLSQNIVE